MVATGHQPQEGGHHPYNSSKIFAIQTWLNRKPAARRNYKTVDSHRRAKEKKTRPRRESTGIQYVFR